MTIRESFPQLCCCAGGAGAAALDPHSLALIGFTNNGITEGSPAAQLMVYLKDGQGGAAGSYLLAVLLALLQSLG